MSDTEWTLIVTTAFLGAVAIFAAVWGPVLADRVKRKALAPALEVQFERRPPFCHRTVWRSTIDPKIEEPVYFFRFEVVNNGRTLARRCEVTIEELWLYDAADNPHKHENFSPVNLSWSGKGIEGPIQFLDINPKRRGIYCDIGHISSPSHQKREEQTRCVDVPGRGNDNLVLQLEQTVVFFSQPNCLPPGKYAIKVSLYSENAPYRHQEVFFEIVWSGKWQRAIEEMLLEAVVTRVNHP
jgi:hypothetical protein